MPTWGEFADTTPALAGFGKDRLQGRLAYLATSRADGSPRVHPVSPVISKGRLFVYMEPTSPKGRDLNRDPRYALHCLVENNSGGGGEFCARGSAKEIKDEQIRATVFEEARLIGYDPKDRYVLFELDVDEAMSTVYEGNGLVRTKWRAS